MEKAICANPELSKLDDDMLRTYKAAQEKGDATAIKGAQKAWLRDRNSCVTTKIGGSLESCLKMAYQDRLQEINQGMLLPGKLNTCTELTLVTKATRFEGATPGESGGEVYMQMNNDIGFFVLSVAGLPKNANSDKHMYHTADFGKGDKLSVCLIRVPKDCPPGDDRGKEYRITNPKNQKSFTGTPDWHSCGGA